MPFTYTPPEKKKKVQINIREATKTYIEEQIKAQGIPFGEYAGQMLDYCVSELIQQEEKSKRKSSKKESKSESKKEESKNLEKQKKETKRENKKVESAEPKRDSHEEQASIFDDDIVEQKTNWHTDKKLNPSDPTPPLDQILDILNNTKRPGYDFSKIDPQEVQNRLKQEQEKGTNMYSWENFMISYIAIPLIENKEGTRKQEK